MTDGYDNPAYGEDNEDPVSKKTAQNGTQETKTFESNDRAIVSDHSLPPKKIAKEDIPYDYRCGYMNCRPDKLQCCNNPKAVLFWLSFFAITQGFVINGINNVNTTSVERRFSLTSTQVGWISSIYDISAGLLVLPITYYGTYGHQPRMLSFMALVMAVGSFIMTLPHFITDNYDLGGDVADKCDPLSNNTSCDNEGTNLSNYLYVLMLGMLLHGIGGTTLYTLGVVYLDSNVKTKNSPLYQGIMLTFSTLGPAVGYLAGGMLLDLYVDIDAVNTENLSINSDDARWVGAWWIGFLCSGSLFIIVSIGMFPFPKETPAGLRATSQRVSEAHQNGAEEECSKEGFMTTWKDVPKAFLLLIANPVLVFTIIATTTEGIVIAGFATFLPKIIQNQFQVSVSWAAILAGFITVPGAAGGNLAAGIFIKCLNLRVRGMLRMACTSCLIVAILSLIALTRCEGGLAIAGLTVPYSDQTEENILVANLTSACNEACDCTTYSYEPICGIDNIEYFSPCHAGCLNYFYMDGQKVYGNCSCVSVFDKTNITTSSVMAVAGVCSTPCNKLNIFLPIFFLVIFFTIGNYVPAANITLRIIPHTQRAFGMGTQAVFTRLLGSVMGPLLFGFVFDDACILWQNKCSEQGSCWIYDTHKFSINLLILSMVIKLASALAFGMALFLYKPPKEQKLVQPLGHNSQLVIQNGNAFPDDNINSVTLDTPM